MSYNNNNYRKKKFLINSENRLASSNSSSDFSIKLDNYPRNHKFNRVGISSISFTKSYLQIDDTNNTISLFEDTGALDLTVTLTNGNYTSTTFGTMLAAALNTASALTYSVALDAVTGRFTITRAAGSSYFAIATVKASNNINSPSISKYIGFPTVGDGQEYVLGGTANGQQSNSGAGALILCDFPSNMQRYKSVTVVSDIARNNNTSQLAWISNIANYEYDAAFTWSNPDMFLNSVDLPEWQLDQYNFRVVDKDGKVIDLRNIDITIELVLFEIC